MWNTKNGFTWVVGTLGAAMLFGAVAMSQSKPATENPAQHTYKQLIYSVRGPDLYRAHCAGCHGSDGKGNGPLAESLSTKPANLTVLAKNNGGTFPVVRVRKFISGDKPYIRTQGREMPEWGPIFHEIEEDQDFGDVRISNLIRYLETMQQR